jgi:hypothetical protein
MLSIEGIHESEFPINSLLIILPSDQLHTQIHKDAEDCGQLQPRIHRARPVQSEGQRIPPTPPVVGWEIKLVGLHEPVIDAFFSLCFERFPEDFGRDGD